MQPPSITRLLISLASLVVIIAGLKLSASLLGPVLLSLFITLACAPLVEILRRRKIPNLLAQTLVVLGVVAAGLALIGFLAISVSQLSAALPSYHSLLTTQLTNLEQWLVSKGIDGSDLMQLQLLQPGELIQLVIAFISGLLESLSNLGLTLFIFIYMLGNAASFSRKLKQGLGITNPMLARLSTFANSISTYLLIKGWLGAMTALGQTLLLWVLGVDFAVLWGVLSFLFNFIPNMGYIIALIPPLITALLKLGIGPTIIVFIGYALINNFFDMVIGPRYLGKGLDLSTLVTFLAVIFWAWIFGPIGAILALPLTVMVKTVVLESYTDSRLLAQLMGSDENSQPESITSKS